MSNSYFECFEDDIWPPKSGLVSTYGIPLKHPWSLGRFRVYNLRLTRWYTALIFAFWYSRKRFYHRTECINTLASGGLRPQTPSGNSATCTPAGSTVPVAPSTPRNTIFSVRYWLQITRHSSRSLKMVNTQCIKSLQRSLGTAAATHVKETAVAYTKQLSRLDIHRLGTGWRSCKLNSWQFLGPDFPKRNLQNQCLRFAMLFSLLKVSYNKHSYRRGTARCVVSVEILPIATQQCSTTSPEQIEVMKLEG